MLIIKPFQTKAIETGSIVDVIYWELTENNIDILGTTLIRLSRVRQEDQSHFHVSSLTVKLLMKSVFFQLFFSNHLSEAEKNHASKPQQKWISFSSIINNSERTTSKTKLNFIEINKWHRIRVITA